MKKILLILLTFKVSLVFGQLSTNSEHTRFINTIKDQGFNPRYWANLLNEFDENPLPLNNGEYFLRILQISDWSPYQLIGLKLNNGTPTVYRKTATKMGFDNSHYNPRLLKGKERKRFYTLMNSIHDSTFIMSREDSIIYETAFVRDTIPFGFKTHYRTIEQQTWVRLTEQVSNDLFKIRTHINELRMATHGTILIFELSSSKGYHVIIRWLFEIKEENSPLFLLSEELNGYF